MTWIPWKLTDVLQLEPWPDHQLGETVVVGVDVFRSGEVTEMVQLRHSTGMTAEVTAARAQALCREQLFAHIDAHPATTYILPTRHPERVAKCWLAIALANDYPVLGTNGAVAFPSVLLQPHERQAYQNHGQTLARLKERGGLGPDEMLAILEDRRWHRVEDTEALERLDQIRGRAATHRPNTTLRLGPLRTQVDYNRLGPCLVSLQGLCPVREAWLEPTEQITLDTIDVGPGLHPWTQILQSGQINSILVSGGEQPMHPDNVRCLRDQAVAAGVPFVFESWGRYRPIEDSRFPGGIAWRDVGREHSGRTLDGREWPEGGGGDCDES